MFKFRFTILTTVLLNVFLLTLEGRAQFYNVFSVANAFSEATVVKSIPKGGFYLVSKTYNNASAQWVATIFRTNCDGSIGWTKSFTHQEVIWPSNLEILSDESILLSLSIGNSLSGQGNHRLMRLDEHGNHIWSKEVPRIGASLSNGFTLDDQENIYLLSSLKDSVYQMISGINVSKFDISGNLIWTKDVHGSKQITPDQIQINSQKEIVVGGDLYYGMDNIFIMVLDSTGNFITNSIFHTGFQTKCGSFVLDDNDNIHLTGQQDDDLLYLNIGPGLNVNSCFKYHFVQKEVGRSIIFYQDTLIIVGDEGGFNERNPLMLSLNIDGSQNWARSYPVSPSFTNYLYDIDLCSDGGYVTTGDLRPVNAGGRVAPIMKTDLYGDMGCFSDDIRLSSSIINMGTASDTTYTTIIPSFSTNASILPEDSFQIRRRAYCDISKPCGGIIVKSPTCPDSLFGFELSGYYSNSLTWSFENGVPSESVTHKPGNVYFEKEGTHQISVMPYNGSDSMHFEDLILWEDTCENIQLSNPTPEPYIPNIFSPNNDGMNDVFEILNLPDQFTLVIYNRWGEELFNTNRKDHFWDGTYNGDKVPSGVYYYILNMPNLNEQTHGYVHVVYE